MNRLQIVEFIAISPLLLCVIVPAACFAIIVDIIALVCYLVTFQNLKTWGKNSLLKCFYEEFNDCDGS